MEFADASSRRGSSCQEEKTPSISPPSDGRLSRGKAKTSRSYPRPGTNPSSRLMEAAHAQNWPCYIICEAVAGTASGCTLSGPPGC
jgi:hypothetical protein